MIMPHDCSVYRHDYAVDLGWKVTRLGVRFEGEFMSVLGVFSSLFQYQSRVDWSHV